MIATAMEVLAFMVFHFLEYFLDPLFIMGITGTDGLKDIWQYSRDIMNIIFAFMLLAVGILTVVNYKMGEELLKANFKKFVLAVILVNFSWFFPRLILDVANVLTATIYQLPAGINKGTIECYKEPPRKPSAEEPGGFPGKKCDIVDDIRFFNACEKESLEAEGLKPKDYVNKGVVCWKRVPWDTSTNTSFGILNGLVANYGRLGELTRVLNPARGPDATAKDERYKQYLMFVMHIFVVLVLMAMLFLPLAAMFVAFLIRIPIMWVTIAFMPFMFIGYLADDKLTPGFNSFEIFKHYVKAAFLPAAVAVPFAIGFILLAEIQEFECPKDIADSLCNSSGPFVHGIESMWQLMMMMIAFIVIWFGFWSAMKIDTIYDTATQGIRSFGSKVGSTALKLPLSIPFIPSGKDGEKMSILGVDNVLSRYKSSIEAGRGPLESLGSAGSASGRDGSRAIVDGLNNPQSTTNKALSSIAQSLRNNRSKPLTKANFESEVRVALDNSNSNLSKGLKAQGIKDPSKLTTAEVIRAMEDSSEAGLKSILDEIKNAPSSSTP